MKEKTTQRLPPQALEIEMAVLGILLMSTKAVDKALYLLQPEYFYKTSNRLIFNAIAELAEEGSKIDLLTVPEKLTELGTIDTAGGVNEISCLADMYYSPAGIEHYITILEEKYLLRNGINFSNKLSDSCYLPKTRAEDMFALMRDFSDSLAKKQIKGSIITGDTLIETRISDLRRRIKNDRILSRYPEVDKILSAGFAPGITVIGGATSSGKSAFKTNKFD